MAPPNEVHPELIGDLLLVSNAPAVPLAELFAFLAKGPQCTFIKQENLALCANPVFWQHGLIAFCPGVVPPRAQAIHGHCVHVQDQSPTKKQQ